MQFGALGSTVQGPEVTVKKVGGGGGEGGEGGGEGGGGGGVVSMTDSCVADRKAN
jgi:hypothetical protein